MKRGDTFKSERHCALDAVYPPAPRSTQPSASSWRLSDAAIALMLVGTIAGLVLGVFG